MNLTRDQILEMPAGPEMDALVAERVMGWRPHVRNTAHYVEAGPAETMVGDYRVRAIVGEWHPSRDIAAAWEVLVELRRRFCCVRLAFDYHYRSAIKVALRPEHDEWLDIELDAGQEPLLISRAALLATLVQP